MDQRSSAVRDRSAILFVNNELRRCYIASQRKGRIPDDGMCSTHKDQVNADLLAFIKGEQAAVA
jgi:hypothetical protein